MLLCDELPVGRDGRPSKSLTFAQAVAVLAAAEAEDSTYGDYTVVSLLTGARTEEARPLAWPEVDLIGRLKAQPPIPPHVNVWRSVRAGGDTKTKKSRRSLALPSRAVDALERQKLRQKRQRESAGEQWQELGIVFASDVGTRLDAANVRRGFRRILQLAGLEPKDWTPRELRHSFVSLLSDSGLTIEEISRLVGRSDTKVTELVYRHQLRPVIQDGAKAMDAISGFRSVVAPQSNDRKGRFAGREPALDLQGPQTADPSESRQSVQSELRISKAEPSILPRVYLGDVVRQGVNERFDKA